MLTLHIPEISSTSGINSDGVFIGSINSINPVAVLLGESLVSISQVLRKAVTTSGATWVDYTTEALNVATSDFAPFGSASDMSIGDAFYFRTLNNEDVHSIYVQIATAGVGSWTLGLQEWSVVNDQWEDVTGLVDNSNGFKAGVGVYQISYTSGAEGLVRLDDISAKFIWHRIVIKTFTSATTAPILSRLWSADTVIKYRDITTPYTTGVFTTIPQEILPRIGDCLIFICSAATMGLDITVTTAESANFTSTWKYIKSNGTYGTLSNVSDPSNGMTVVGTHKIRFSIPTDWGSRSITDKDGVVHTGFIICRQTTTVSVESPVAPSHNTVKTKSLGTGNVSGIKMYANIVVKAISIPRIGIPSATAVDIAVLNLTPSNLTNISSTITIPANAVSANIDIQDITFNANEELGISCLSNTGTVKDVDLILQ